MKAVNPYLNFPGNTLEAFNFYKSVFGGEFTNVVRFGDTPESGRVSEKVKDKIMHIALPIGNGNILMATDAIEEMGHKIYEGNNYHISLGAESKEEADRLYKGLSEGGKASMPMADTFWGDYFGMLKDKFGVQWMIGYTKPKG
jgi:PhnB protein